MWKTTTLSALAVAGAMGAWAAAPPQPAVAQVRAFRIGGPRLGVQLEELSGEVARKLGLDSPRGARVTHVEEGSPAASAGVREGDVILGFDGERVRSVAQLVRLVAETPAGRELALELAREGGRQTLKLSLAEGGVRSLAGELGQLGEGLQGLQGLRGLHFERPLIEPGHPGFDWSVQGPGQRWAWRKRGDGPRLGLRFQEVSGQLAAYFGVPGERNGLLVVEVEPDSAAARAGLQAGDVLLSVGGRELSRGRDLREALDEAESGAALAVRLLRRGEQRSLEVRPESVPEPEGDSSL